MEVTPASGISMPATVLLTSCLFQNTPGPHQELMAKAGLRLVPLRGPLPESELRQAVGDCDGLLCDTDDVTARVVEAAVPRLRLISKVGASSASIDLDACRSHGIEVMTTTGINHHAVAEHTLGLILSLARNIPASFQGLREGRWPRDPGNELRGRRLGILGFGRIGREVARLGAAFGMEVTAFARHGAEAVDGVAPAATVEELVGHCDILSLHAPLSPETFQLVDAKLLAQLPPGALVVNTARAALVDHGAILDALESGRLGGYASDVPEREPPDPDDPLLHHPRVVFTPHTGSLTYQSIPRLLVRAAENVVDYFQKAGEGTAPVG